MSHGATVYRQRITRQHPGIVHRLAAEGGIFTGHQLAALLVYQGTLHIQVQVVRQDAALVGELQAGERQIIVHLQ
ncbi:hypothetical protein D3C75_1206450 [compost metagenome]